MLMGNRYRRKENRYDFSTSYYIW